MEGRGQEQEAITKTVTAEIKSEDQKRFEASKHAADAYEAYEKAVGEKTLKQQKKMNADQLAAYVKMLREKKAAAKAEGLDVKDFDQQVATSEVELAKKVAKEKMDLALEATGSIMGSLGEMFGGAKEFAYAEALINTYLGATNALSQGDTYSAVFRAAAIIIAGMAQVANIAKTEPKKSGGFDNPAHDAMAYAGGMRWAQDMIREYSAGLSRGWGDGMMGKMQGGGQSHQTQYINDSHNSDNSRGATVHLNQQILTPVEADRAYIGVEKRLQVAHRTVDRQTAGATVTTIGSKRRR